MQKTLFILLALLLLCTPVWAAEGLVTVKSNHSVAKTADRLEKIIQKKGMTLFARIDHTAGAKKAGKQLAPTQVLVFGNPKIGSVLMACSQSMGIDLPQKMLVYKDAKSQVWLAYNAPKYLAKRHGTRGCGAVLTKVQKALAGFAKAAAK